MIHYLQQKLKKYRARKKFQEYDYKIIQFDIPGHGIIEYAQWQNPLERPKILTADKIDFFRQFVQPGDWAIDIGAHTGDTPLPIAIAAGAQGKVLALEPNPHIFRILKVNSALNYGKVNIIPLDFAATLEDGEFFYNSSEASFNNGGISDQKINRHGRFSLQTTVKGLNLEKYLNVTYKNDLHKIKLIKIDAEGYDSEVLRSIDSFVYTYRPVLIFECFQKLSEDDRKILFDRVASKGYNLFYFEDFAINTKVKQISRNDMMNWKHFDIYAIPWEEA